MAMIVAMERGFITRTEGLARMNKILGFLETCDRYHGVWPHWLNGATGKTVPFSQKDNGGDLVETSFLIQGLIAFRQYLDPGVPSEKLLIDRINILWQAVEFDFFTQGRNALYWHWSPNYGFEMNMILRGYNETLICYVLGAGSPTHTVSRDTWRYGYMNDGAIMNGSSYYGITLPMGPSYGGPLFFTHYSFLGLDPRALEDSYVNYMEQNIAHSLINWKHCETNPSNYVSYSSHCWGLTASDNQSGYSAHSPTNDLGVITPTAALSSLPYTPEQSMNAIRHGGPASSMLINASVEQTKRHDWATARKTLAPIMDEAKAIANLAVLDVLEKDYEAAIAKAGRLFTDKSTQLTAAYVAATAYAGLGKYEDAQRAYRGAIRFLPPDRSWMWNVEEMRTTLPQLLKAVEEKAKAQREAELAKPAPPEKE